MAERGNRGDTRERLLGAAREVFAAKGLEAATVSEIVARAGVAQGTFYLYFPSKLSAVQALAEQMVQGTLAAVEAAVAPVHTLGEALDAALRAVYREAAAYSDIVATIHSAAGLLAVEGAWEGVWAPYVAYTEALLRRWLAGGAVDAEIEPAIAARLVSAVFQAAAEDLHLYRRGVPDDAVIGQVVRFLHRALAAC